MDNLDDEWFLDELFQENKDHDKYLNSFILSSGETLAEKWCRQTRETEVELFKATLEVLEDEIMKLDFSVQDLLHSTPHKTNNVSTSRETNVKASVASGIIRLDEVSQIEGLQSFLNEYIDVQLEADVENENSNGNEENDNNSDVDVSFFSCKSGNVSLGGHVPNEQERFDFEVDIGDFNVEQASDEEDVHSVLESEGDETIDDKDTNVDDQPTEKKSVENFTILSWNLNTFKEERLQIVNEVLNEYKVDVFCVNESGVNPNAINYKTITNYTLVGACNKNHSEGRKGGVLVYVANYLVHRVISIPITEQFKDCQVIGFQINDNNFYSIYRSPNQDRNDQEKLISWLHKLDTSTTYIFGDLNIRANWESYVPENKKHEKFIEFFLENDFKQMVSKITFPRGKSILDILLTNDPSDFKGVLVVDDLDLPPIDHYPIVFVIDGQVELLKGKKFKPIKNIKKKEYEEAVEKFNWEPLALSNDIDYIANNLVKNLREIYYDNVPYYYVNPNKIRKYEGLSSRTKKLYVKRRKAKKRGDFEFLKRTRKTFKKLLKDDKHRKALEMADKMDKDKNLVWRLTKTGKEIKGKKMGLEDCDGNLEFDEQKKADLHMEHISKNETEKTYKTVNTDVINDKARITSVEFTAEKIIRRIKKAKSSWALAPDESFTNLFKYAGNSIILVIVVLFTLVLKKGKLAIAWLTSKITLIEKKGDLSKVNSWRPLKIQAYLLRLFEGIIAEEIFEILEEANFFWHQYAYRIGISTVDNLLDYWIHLNENIDLGHSMSTLYLDLKAAFDRTSHGHLIDIFYNEAGIQGDLIRVLEAWLTDRKHYVKLGEHKSTVFPVKSGNQQGSSIGPLAYNIYCQYVLNKCREWGEELEIEGFAIFCFADDTKFCWANVPGNREKVQIFLDRLVKLFEDLHLAPNVAKCKILHFKPNNNPKWDFKLGNEQLLISEDETDLGLITKNNMKFDAMAQSCEKNAKNAVKLVRKVAKMAKYTTKKQLWYGQVASRITYASPIWRSNKFDKIFTNIYVDYWKFFRIPKWDTPPRTPIQEFTYHDLIMLFRIYNELSPVKREHLFPKKVRETRFSQSEIVNNPRDFKHWKNNLLVRNLEIWNNIPKTYKTTHSLGIFKGYVKRTIIPKIDEDLVGDLLSGELRRKHLKKRKIAIREAKRRDFCLEMGLPGNTKLDRIFDSSAEAEKVENTGSDSSKDDDYIPNEPLCLRANYNRRSKKAIYISKHFPRNQNGTKFEKYKESQCNCNNEFCKKELQRYNSLYPHEKINFEMNTFQ